MRENVSKLTDFIDFLNILIAKHDDLDIKDIVKGIRTIIHTLSDDSRIKQLHDSYKFESSLLQYYIEHFVKPINGGNMGTTCSICMQRSVNRFSIRVVTQSAVSVYKNVRIVVLSVVLI